MCTASRASDVRMYSSEFSDFSSASLYGTSQQGPRALADAPWVSSGWETSARLLQVNPRRLGRSGCNCTSRTAHEHRLLRRLGSELVLSTCRGHGDSIVEVLCYAMLRYTPEGRSFFTIWSMDFSVYLILPASLWSWSRLSL
jgi:hypothetical protein